MAWAIALGGNQRIALGLRHYLQVGDTLTYNGLFEDSGSSFQMFVDFYSVNGNYVAFKDGGSTFFSRINNVTQSATVNMLDGDVFEYIIERTVSEYIHTLDGVELFRHSYAGSIGWAGFGHPTYKIKGQFRGCTISNAGTTHDWNPTASDRSNGGGPAPYPQPIVIDTVGGNNATGVSFSTTDLGYWVDLGGGVTGVIPQIMNSYRQRRI